MKEQFQILDVMKVRADQKNPGSAIKTYELPSKIRTIECDILIVGGGTGGVAAALAASKGKNLKICVTEQTKWLGGQMTSQGVSVLDEGRNFQIETSGANLSYQQFRNAIRNYYKQTYKLSTVSLEKKYFNPGNGWYWVSQLSFEPEVAVRVINDQLSNSKASSVPEIFLRTIPVKVEQNNSQITRIITVNLDTDEWLAFEAKTYIDATELGDLLALSGAAYVAGAESKSDTCEPHAAQIADSERIQDYVFPFIVEFVPGTNNTIPKPYLYEYYNNQGKFSLLNYKMFEYGNKTNDDGVVVSELMSFWTYRRIVDKTVFCDPRVNHDAAVINWFSNDFRDHNIIDKPPHTVSQNLSLAKALSLGFLYWLQTEAPRDEGGKGYPEIRLKSDALGTQDGLSMYPYIRESRRGKTFTIIKEQDIVNEQATIVRARVFDDSIGIGFFPIDIHEAGYVAAELNPTKRFQIPLGALLMPDPTNMILSCKNIGMTHLSNGAYRLHPIEWAIGEAAGALASYAIEHKSTLHNILNKPEAISAFQLQMIHSGVPLYWYDDVTTTHPDFVSIQYLAVLDIMRGDSYNLHFNPQAMMDEKEAAKILLVAHKRFKLPKATIQAPVLTSRGAFAAWLYEKLKKTGFRQADNT